MTLACSPALSPVESWCSGLKPTENGVGVGHLQSSDLQGHSAPSQGKLPKVRPRLWGCLEPSPCFRGEPFSSRHFRQAGFMPQLHGGRECAHFSGSGLRMSQGRSGVGDIIGQTGSQAHKSSPVTASPPSLPSSRGLSSSAGRNVFPTI